MATGIGGYDLLARHYDALMQGVPYWRWAEFISKLARGIGAERIIDVGCGTGTVALALARKGYAVFGIDESVEMLAMARNKALAANLSVTWLQNNFWGVQLPCNIIISTCDGVNHLLKVRDVLRFFHHAYTNLERGGLLIFDINSPYKFEHILAGETFYWRHPNLDIIWVNEYIAPINWANIILYEGRNGNYKKSSFEVIERCYESSTLLYYLRKCGFQRVSLWNNYQGRLRSAKASRITLVAQK